MSKFKYYPVLLLIANHSVLGQSDKENLKPISWHDIPEWIASGVEKLKLDEHLENRVFDSKLN